MDASAINSLSFSYDVKKEKTKQSQQTKFSSVPQMEPNESIQQSSINMEKAMTRFFLTFNDEDLELEW